MTSTENFGILDLQTETKQTMQYKEFAGASVIYDQVLATIVPRCKENTGYFSFTSSDLQLDSLTVVVLSKVEKLLTIPPYFDNTEFSVMTVIPVFEVSADSKPIVELHELKFTGKSKDSLIRFIGAKVRKQILEAMSAKKRFDIEAIFPLAMSMQMNPEITDSKNRYFSVGFKEAEIPAYLKTVDLGYCLESSAKYSLLCSDSEIVH